MKSKYFVFVLSFIAVIICCLLIYKPLVEVIASKYNNNTIVDLKKEKQDITNNITNIKKEIKVQNQLLLENENNITVLKKEYDEVAKKYAEYEGMLDKLMLYNKSLCDIYDYYNELFQLLDLSIIANYDFDSAKALSSKNKLEGMASNLLGNWLTDMIVSKDIEKDNGASTALIDYNKSISFVLSKKLISISEILKIRKGLEFCISLSEIERESEDAYLNLRMIEMYFNGEPYIDVYNDRMVKVLQEISELNELLNIIYSQYKSILLGSDVNNKYLNNMVYDIDDLRNGYEKYMNDKSINKSLDKELVLEISKAYKDIIDVYCGEPLHLGMSDLSHYSIRVYNAPEGTMAPLAVYNKNIDDSIIYICERTDDLKELRKYYFDSLGKLVCIEFLNAGKTLYFYENKLINTEDINADKYVEYAYQLNNDFHENDFKARYAKLNEMFYSILKD